MNFSLNKLVLLLCFFLPQIVIAGPYGAEFAADASRKLPHQKQPQTARLIVGKEGRRRVEYSVGSKDVVEIIIPEKGITWRLDPADKTYIEIKREPTPNPAEVHANPCAGQKNMVCNSLGKVQIKGRNAEKWEITVSFSNQNVKMLRWVDSDNGFPLIQEMPNGQRAEMILLGEEQIGGRKVEKWELLSSWKSRSAKSYQWYDPVLKLAVREEGREGMVNVLENIKEGAQPEHLFQIPVGYIKTEAPNQSGLKMVPVK